MTYTRLNPEYQPKGSYAPAGHNHLSEAQWMELGSASSGIATRFALPSASGTYLLATTHNSTAGSNSLWMVRPAGNKAFLMGGGSNITVTVSGANVDVTSTGGTIIVYLQKL